MGSTIDNKLYSLKWLLANHGYLQYLPGSLFVGFWQNMFAGKPDGWHSFFHQAEGRDFSGSVRASYCAVETDGRYQSGIVLLLVLDLQKLFLHQLNSLGKCAELVYW